MAGLGVAVCLVRDHRCRLAGGADGPLPSGGRVGLCTILSDIGASDPGSPHLRTTRACVAGTWCRRAIGQDLGHHRNELRGRHFVVGGDAALGRRDSGGDLWAGRAVSYNATQPIIRIWQQLPYHILYMVSDYLQEAGTADPVGPDHDR